MTLPREKHPLADEPAVAVFVECLTEAVCHATNWDRLRGHLLGVAARDPYKVAPLRLKTLSVDRFVREFGPAFADEVRDLPRRHGMFTEVAGAFAERGGFFDGRSLTAQPQSLAGPAGLYAALDRLEPFRADPQRKKSRVFVQQLLRFGFLKPVDHTIERPRGGGCPFGGVCEATRDASLAKLTEPQLASHHAFY